MNKEIIKSMIPKNFGGEVIIKWHDNDTFFAIETNKGNYELEYDREELVEEIYKDQLSGGFVVDLGYEWDSSNEGIIDKVIEIPIREYDFTDEDALEWINGHKKDWKKIED